MSSCDTIAPPKRIDGFDNNVGFTWYSPIASRGSSTSTTPDTFTSGALCSNATALEPVDCLTENERTQLTAFCSHATAL